MKTHFLLFTLFTGVCMLFYAQASAQTFAGGDGTAGNPYQIGTAAQLASIRHFMDKHFVLTADIDLNGYGNWKPIGKCDGSNCLTSGELPDESQAFQGVLDGNGHVISNLQMNWLYPPVYSAWLVKRE